MRLLLLAVVLASWGCSSEESAPSGNRQIVVPDYALDAFGGRLLGTDHGEWIGKLMFQDADGDVDTLLSENVHGIVENSEGIFVFTGLAHLSINDGFIYVVARNPSGELVASRIGKLPGAPTRVTQPQIGGATTFLVYSGYSNDRQLFECYQLIGKIVSRAYDCLPPKSSGP